MRSTILVLRCAAVFMVLVARAVDASAQSPDLPPVAISNLYSSGSYDLAARQLQMAIDQNPKDASLQYWLGRCFFEMRDFDHAVASLKRAVSLQPHRSEYYDWLGRAYGRKAEKSSGLSALSEAKRCKQQFELAVQLDPRNIRAQRDLIEFIADAPPNIGGGEERGFEQIQALSAVDPLQGELALADFYAERKKFTQADTEYERVLGSSPKDIEAFFEAADYYRGRSNATGMEQAVAGAEKISPSDRRLNYYRGVALVLENMDLESADKALQTYIADVPENSELPPHSSAYAYLGRLYENEHHSELSAKEYKKALDLDSGNRLAREGLRRLQKDLSSRSAKE